MRPSHPPIPVPQPNRQELSPIFLLERAGEVYAERPAVTDGDQRYSWREFRLMARRFASALRAGGLQKGDRVAFLAFNSEPLLQAHFAVPLAGGILVAINTRLNPEEMPKVAGRQYSSDSRETFAKMDCAFSHDH